MRSSVGAVCMPRRAKLIAGCTSGRGRKRGAPAEVEGAVVAAAEPLVEPSPATAEPVPVEAEAQAEPPRRPRKELPPDEIVVSSTTSTEEAPKKKAGWWQRGFFG